MSEAGEERIPYICAEGQLSAHLRRKLESRNPHVTRRSEGDRKDHSDVGSL
jgi:hypothetical protein